MKNFLFKLPYLTVLCFGFFSCDTELEKANPLENLNISTGLVTEVESFSATIKGVISTNEFNGVENYGHCWSISENPTIEDNCTFLGEIQASNYEFLSFLENLDIEENYFVRAFAIANGVPIYGNEITLQTVWGGDIPLIETIGANYITSNSAIGSAEIIDFGESNIIRLGHCWSESPVPTLDDFKTEITEYSTGFFTSNFNNLNSSSTYYYRAYAENSQGISFGSILSFSTTNGSPSVITTNISNINSNSAIVEGEITGIGDSEIIKYGHCWSISENPTVSNSFKTEYENGSPETVFQSNIENLNPATDYFVRAYATNSYGTSYGETISFTTPCNITGVTNSPSYPDMVLLSPDEGSFSPFDSYEITLFNSSPSPTTGQITSIDLYLNEEKVETIASYSVWFAFDWVEDENNGGYIGTRTYSLPNVDVSSNCYTIRMSFWDNYLVSPPFTINK